jgi:hypothetical protein
MLPVLESTVCLERTQECLLERVVGSLGTQASPKQAQHFDAVLLVEALEGWYRHGVHHRHPTHDSAHL